jgi:hypothetical protein
MSDLPTSKDAARILTHLAQARPGPRQRIESEGLPPEVSLLRTWQTNRLSRTYDDFLRSKRFRPAAIFFLNDIYAPTDFSQRNADLERFYDGLRKALPERALVVLADGIKLHQMTDDMDYALAEALVDKLGVTDTITEAQYAEAYRICDNYEERLQQIRMIDTIGRGVDHMVRLPFVGLALKLAHAPAHLAGWQDLQGFLERGFSAFKHMKGADEFLGTIQHRETQILDRIFAGEPEPFAI